jgi:Domain of unknown function (DUF4417)
MQLVSRKLNELKKNISNYRRHPPLQIKMMQDSLAHHGQIRPLVIQPDGTILCGHCLYDAMKASRYTEADCLVYTGANPEALLIIDNRMALMAYDDQAMLDALLKEVGQRDGSLVAAGYDDDFLKALLAGMQPSDTMAWGIDEALDEIEDLGLMSERDRGASPTRPSDAEGSVAREGQKLEADYDAGEDLDALPFDVPTGFYPSDNAWGVPTLDSGMQATRLGDPILKWGSVARHSTRIPGGTWHFYTDDYKFDALWKDPTPVVNSRCESAAEINFSSKPGDPRAIVLWSVYQKRWLARYWQSVGIGIFVDLNMDLPFWELNMLGVPKGWRSYIQRGYSMREYDVECLDELARRAEQHAGTSDIVMWVYGGGQRVREIAKQRGWLWSPEHRDQHSKHAREAFEPGYREGEDDDA